MQTKTTELKQALLSFLIISSFEMPLAGMNTEKMAAIDEKINSACIQASISRSERFECCVDELYSPHDGPPKYYTIPKSLKLFLYQHPDKIDMCCHLHIAQGFPEEHVMVQLGGENIGTINHSIISSHCNGMNLIHRATLLNNIKAIEYLSSVGDKIFDEFVNQGTVQPVHLYTKYNKLEFPTNSTPLHLAIRLGFYDIALVLLSRGASPWALDADRKTSLEYFIKLSTPAVGNSRAFAKIKKLFDALSEVK